MFQDQVAVIVFADIVGFSKYLSYKQNYIITSLNAELSRELFPHLSRFGSNPSMICLPTGDGMALVFIGGCEANVLFSLILCLIEWTKGVTKQERLEPPCKIRIGVHAGSVSIITDINRLPNVCGDDINTCRRIMDQARSNQVLFSESAYDRYIRQDNMYSGFPFSRESPAEFSKPTWVTAKHNKPFEVRVMFRRDEEGWNQGSPMSVPTVIDGKDAAARRTALMNELLSDLAESNQRELTVYEQATFSTFGIIGDMEAGYDQELTKLCLRQRTLLEELMRKKTTTVKVIIRPIPKAETEWPGVNARVKALAVWMDTNLVGDVFRTAEERTTSGSKVQFREALAEEMGFWRSVGPNVFMVRDQFRIDGYRLRNDASHGLSLVYYEEYKIRDAMDEFDKAFSRAQGQTNADIRKKLEVFLSIPDGSARK